jgi:hypothetical protein
VNCRIEPQKFKVKGQTCTAVEMDLSEYFVGRASDADGAKKRGGRLADALDATCRKLTDKSVPGTLQ